MKTRADNDPPPCNRGPVKKTEGNTGRLTAILLAVLLISWLPVCVGCSDRNADVHTLKLWTDIPETAWQAGPIKRFAVNVEEKTDGRVVVKSYWSGSLAPVKEALDGVKGGLIDIGQFSTMYSPGEFPVSDIAGLPFLVSSPYGVVEGLRKLYAEGLLPEYEGKGFKVLDFCAPGMQYLLFRDKLVDTLAQFDGLKIRSQTSVTVQMLKAFGATPVAMAGTDLYMSLDRGVIDGVLSSPGYMAPTRLYEVAKFFLDEPLYGGNSFFAVNQKTWDSLPSDLQEILSACSGDFITDWLDTSNQAENIDNKNTLAEKGVTFYTLKPGELENMKKATAPIIDEFIQNMDALGLQGQKIVDVFKAAQDGQ